MTVEIGNTDAEGRLVLADAISLADEEAPDYLVTIATLTGAARVALGPDLPPLYTDDEDLAARPARLRGSAVGDPLWRMPFWTPYDKLLKSSIADVNHIAEGSFAGSIIAALFLKRFVRNAKRFAHLDIFGWVPREQPGRPKGGEPQARPRAVPLLPPRAWNVVTDAASCPIRAATPIAPTSRPSALRGLVEAPRYVKGEPRQVGAPSLASAP